MLKLVIYSVAIVAITAMFSGCTVAESGDGADGPTDEAVSALAADCENGANGFIDISDSLTGTQQRTVGVGTATVTLQSGTISGAERGWAKISGGTNTHYSVWMDWTVDGGNTIKVRCGPFAVGGTNQTKTSAAKNTSKSSTWQFRACGLVTGPAPQARLNETAVDPIVLDPSAVDSPTPSATVTSACTGWW